MGIRDRIRSVLPPAIEVGVLAMVCVSPWAFGSVEPLFEFLLYAALALLLLLWGVRMLAEGRFWWKRCPVAWCLAALFLFCIIQVQPISRPLLQTLSPNTPRLLDELLPAQPEQLPFGEARSSPSLAAGRSLSLYPGATQPPGHTPSRGDPPVRGGA